MTEVIEKSKDHAFRKDVYLLGKDSDGVKYWLEAPTWDCGWYWGFGYIETYRSNRTPSKAVDIDSHQHAKGKYKSMNDDSKLNYHSQDENLFTGDFLTSKTFTESEAWALRELFSQFYHLKGQAGFYGRGGMHVTTLEPRHALKDQKQAYKVNTQMIPMIIKNILQVLCPDDSYASVVDAQRDTAKKSLARNSATLGGHHCPLMGSTTHLNNLKQEALKMSLTIEAGRLISTTDMRLARKLQQIVKIADITGGREPLAIRQSKKCVSFMLGGEFYELEAVSA